MSVRSGPVRARAGAAGGSLITWRCTCVPATLLRGNSWSQRPPRPRARTDRFVHKSGRHGPAHQARNRRSEGEVNQPGLRSEAAFNRRARNLPSCFGRAFLLLAAVPPALSTRGRSRSQPCGGLDPYIHDHALAGCDRDAGKSWPLIFPPG